MKTLAKLFMLLMVLVSISNSSEAQTNFTKKIGGTSGSSFIIPSTRADILSTESISRIAIQHGRRIEQIEIEYSNVQGFSRVESIGNDAGEWSYIELEQGEFITYITGKAGTLLDQLTFYTSMRRTFGPYGGSGGEDFEISIPSDAKVIGFTGKVGPSINQIGLIYKKPNRKTGVTKNPERGTRYQPKYVSNNPKSSSKNIRDHRTNKSKEMDKLRLGLDNRISQEDTKKDQDSTGVLYADGIHTLVQVTQLKSQFANEEALVGTDNTKGEEKPKPAKETLKSKTKNIRDHRTNNINDSTDKDLGYSLNKDDDKEKPTNKFIDRVRKILKGGDVVKDDEVVEETPKPTEETPEKEN